MTKMFDPQQDYVSKEQDQRAPYVAPAVVYEGTISTRAGSPFNSPEKDGGGLDPADLFGD